MGAELGRAEAGQKIQTHMTVSQLKDFVRKKKKKKSSSSVPAKGSDGKRSPAWKGAFE